MSDNETNTASQEAPAPAPTVVDELKAKFGDVITALPDFRGELAVSAPKENLVDVLSFLYKERKPAFEMLVDVCGADYPDREKRFEIVYHLRCMATVTTIRVKIAVAEGEDAPSVTHLWESANWQEREAYDMFGVKFDGHPNMARILMWEGYDGWPLRKDFPLRGNTPPEKRYNEKDMRLTRNPKQYCWEGYCTDL